MLINISLAVDQVNLVLTALNQMQTNAGNAMAAIQQQAQQQVKQPDFPPIDPEPAAGTD
jgi:hypothetical protein